MPIDYKNLFNNICTDTRQYQDQEYFLAIPGERHNPLEHIKPILNNERLKKVIYQDNEKNNQMVSEYKNLNSSIEYIGVPNFFQTLKEISLNLRREWGCNPDTRLIAITGSNGKTTVKEMIAFILNGLCPGQVIKTLSNNNNHIGVPLTLFQLKEDTRFAVVELGSNAPGEIKNLCENTEPDCAVTTNVGYTHMEFFKDLNAVFLEECTPYHFIKNKNNNFYLINKMDVYLGSLEQRKQDLTFGANQCDFEVTINSNNIGFTGPFTKLVANGNLLGKHNFVNLAMAISICYQILPERLEEIIDLAQTFKPGLNRSEWKTYQDKKVFLDAYNANPSSMIAALEGFKEFNPNRSLVVIGDMNELGEYTQEGHKRVGKFLRECGFKDVVFIGRYSKYYLEEYPFADSYDSAEVFKEEFTKKINNYDLVFLKASRTLKLETLLDS